MVSCLNGWVRGEDMYIVRVWSNLVAWISRCNRRAALRCVEASTVTVAMHMPGKPRRGARRDLRLGISLLEVLIVIAILSLLIALLIPAVQLARETARHASCWNNLRHYGTSMHAYLSGRGQFPSGLTARITGPIEVSEWVVHNYMIELLPYLAVSGAESYDYDVNFFDQRNRTVVAQRLPFAICPSAPSRKAVQKCTFVPSAMMTQSAREEPLLAPLLRHLDGKYSASFPAGFTDYTVLSGCEAEIAQRLGFNASKTSPIGVRGMFPFPIESQSDALKAFGPILNEANTVILAKGLRPADIVDGMSHTFMMVEVAGRPEHWVEQQRTKIREPVDRSWADPRIQELNAHGDETRLIQHDNIESLYGFHLSGVSAVFADSHVATIGADASGSQIVEWMTPAGLDHEGMAQSSTP